ncbi:unnamed protein product, partial [Closterium sp. NIES-54]
GRDFTIQAKGRPRSRFSPNVQRNRRTVASSNSRDGRTSSDTGRRREQKFSC